MREEQPIATVTVETLVAEVKARRDQGWRLVQIGVTSLGESFEINYSFDREQRFFNLRLTVPAANVRLPSVSGVYWCAFLYENEIHDLFGITFDGLALDFKGNFYQTAKPFPFAQATPGVSTSVVKPTA
jgi:ech hydrogenase subunit D